MKKVVYIVLLLAVVGTLVIFTKKYNSNELMTKEEEMILADSGNCQNNNAKFITVFDLDTFINNFSYTTEKYDYLKVAFAVQGLLNRDRPRLFYKYQNGNDYKVKNSKGQPVGIDDFWLEELKKTECYVVVNEYEPTLDSFHEIIKDAIKEKVIKGVVLWDNNVPATSNVASTIAGVENLIPIRYDISKESCYTDLVSSGKIFTENDIKKDLVDKFVNISTLPNEKLEPGKSGIQTTKSAKNDAYLWAKKYYLDTKKTNSSLMAYSRDAWTPDNECTNQACFIGASITDYIYSDDSYKKALENKYLKKENEALLTPEFSLTILNNSNETWTSDKYIIAAKSDNEFEIVDSEYGVSDGNKPKEVKLSLDDNNPISPGERFTIKYKIRVPKEDGSYNLKFGVMHDGDWLTGEYKKTIRASLTSNYPIFSRLYPTFPNYKAHTNIKRDENHVMFSTALNSSDYLIMKKAFFFDLSPEGIAPIDDRKQMEGTDTKMLEKLLESQSKNNNHKLFTVVGFVPWFVKYSKTSDANSSLVDQQAEWLMVDIISSYGGQTDADAYSPVGLTNASIYTYSELKSPFKQKNDKETKFSKIFDGIGGSETVSDSEHVVKEVYNKDTTYFTMYMGDYDGGAWTSSVLPHMFQSDKEDDDKYPNGKYPLAWPIASDLSKRIPHVFNWLYANQKRNDYFVASDNGTGYFNPQYDNTINEEILNMWKDHNIEMNEYFDIDITGNLVTSARPISETVKKIYSKMTPILVGTQVSTDSYGNTPFVKVEGVDKKENETINEAIYRTLQNTSGNFIILRTIQLSRKDAYNAIEYVLGKSKKYKIVDPYTLAYLYNQKPTQSEACYTNGKEYSWLTSEKSDTQKGYKIVEEVTTKINCNANYVKLISGEDVDFDINEDGFIDGRDVIRLMKYEINPDEVDIPKEDKERQIKKADLNLDGELDVVDYVYLMKYLIR